MVFDFLCLIHLNSVISTMTNSISWAKKKKKIAFDLLKIIYVKFGVYACTLFILIYKSLKKIMTIWRDVYKKQVFSNWCCMCWLCNFLLKRIQFIRERERASDVCNLEKNPWRCNFTSVTAFFCAYTHTLKLTYERHFLHWSRSLRCIIATNITKFYCFFLLHLVCLVFILLCVLFSLFFNYFRLLKQKINIVISFHILN